MSWLSEATGIHISPKGVHIDPMKALGTALAVGTGGVGAGLKMVGGKLAGPLLNRGQSQPMDEQLPDEIPTATYYNPDGSIKSQTPIDGMKPVSQAAPQSGGGWGDLLKQGLGFLGNHKDDLLGGAALYEGYKNNKQGTDLRNEGLDLLKNSYGERAGLRKLGVQGMMNEQAPDLSGVFAPAASNPYSRLKKVG